MRAGTRKTILFAVLAAIVAYLAFDSGGGGLWTRNGSRDAAKRDTGKDGDSGAQGAGAEKRAGRYALPERAPLGDARAELFGTRSWQPPAPKPSALAAPVAPPMPYRFAGKLLQDGKLQVFLARDDAVVPIRQGETLDGVYRVEAIGETQITLLYLPLKQKETISVSSSLPVETARAGREKAAEAVLQDTPATTATNAKTAANANTAADAKTGLKGALLLWEGPQNVKLGTPFSVALRVSSDEPVFASPVQLKYDPKLLEPVAVKPGKFFSQDERSFSYRVNPEGSIFIGASKRSHALADDAEFLVLTFKPLKPAPVAELSIASMNLQGPAGRAITFEPLEVFKTAITP